MTVPPTSITLDVYQDWLISANERTHWAVRSRKTRQLRQLAKLRARDLPPLDRAHCTCRITWRRRHRRDAANWSPTAKALIDGCVDAGLLVDDSRDYLVGPDMREGDPDPTLRPGFVRVELVFEEIT